MIFKKHVGKLKSTDRRIVVVFNQLPERTDSSLVVEIEALPDSMHDALMAVVESPEAQSTNDLYKVLQRRLMPNSKTDMLTTLHNMGRLTRANIDNIIMVPHPSKPVPLRYIIDELNGMTNQQYNNTNINENNVPINEQYDIPVNDINTVNQYEINNIMNGVPYETVSEENSKLDKNEQKRRIAMNLIIQATDLEMEAAKKRREAYNIDPSLKPKDDLKEKTPSDLAIEHLEKVSERETEKAQQKLEESIPKRVGRPKKRQLIPGKLRGKPE